MSHSEKFENSPLNARSGADWGELLSAYIDDEVSLAERQQVEQRLAENGEYRELLHDLQSLSASIRDLPAVPPPSELRTAVLHQATLQWATRGPAVVNPTPVSPASVKIRSWRREWWVAGLATVATAVVVMLLPVTGRPTVDLQLAENPTVLAPARALTRFGVDVAPVTTFADTEVAVDFARLPEPRMGRNASALSDNQLNEMEVFEKREALVNADGARKWSEDSPEAKLETWEDLQPYLSLLSQNPGTVANVDVIVVDVKQAADQFEVLLLQNGVAVMPEEQPQAAAAPSAKEGASSRAAALSAFDSDKDSRFADAPSSESLAASKRLAGSGELVAVYVEANGEPITKALAEMVRQRSLVAMKLQPPLQLPGNQRGLADNTQLAGAERNSLMELARLTPELRDAYRQNTASLQQAHDGISAEDSLENLPSEPERRLTGRMMKRNVGESLPEAVAGNAPGSGQNPAVANNSVPLFNTVPMDIAAGNSLSLNFSQRLTLPSPAQEFGTELPQNQSQSLLRNSAVAIPSLGIRSPNSLEAERFSLSQSPSMNGNLAAPQAVRVLFVLQQAPEARSTPK